MPREQKIASYPQGKTMYWCLSDEVTGLCSVYLPMDETFNLSSSIIHEIDQTRTF